MTVPHDRRPTAEEFMQRWLHRRRSSRRHSPDQQSGKPARRMLPCRSRQGDLPCWSDLAMYWLIRLALVHSMSEPSGAVPAGFVIDLRAQVDDRDRLPSASQTGEAPPSMVLSAAFNNSTVIIMSTWEGDIMPDGPHTTINDNTTKIESSASNISVASTQVSQINAENIDGQKIREFADLISQIAPTLGLAKEQLIELQSDADELRGRARDRDRDRRRTGPRSGRRDHQRVAALMPVGGCEVAPCRTAPMPYVTCTNDLGSRRSPAPAAPEPDAGQT
jgi:hypothetical protein